MQEKLFASYIDALHRDAAVFCGEMLKEKGITLGLLYFILYVCSNPGCTPVQLSRAVGLDRAYTLRCIHKLVEEDCFIRKPHPTDGRATLLYPTPKATEIASLSRQMLEDWDAHILSGLSAEEKQLLFRILEKLQKKG